MTDLVKRLRATWSVDASQGDSPQLTELEITDSPSDICQEAADTIERLEVDLANAQAAYKEACDIAAEAKAEIQSRKDWHGKIINSNSRAIERTEKAEAALADARAEIEQLKEQIARMAMGEAGMRDNQIDAAVAKSKREALAAPAPERDIQEEIIDCYGQGAALPKEPTTKGEAERRLVTALAKLYLYDGCSLPVAEVCDEYLDRSGKLLGEVREAAQQQGEPET